MRKYLIVSFALVFLFLSSNSVLGQTVDEQDVLERAKMVAEITKLRELNVAKDTIIAEQKNTIEVYKKLDAGQESRIADLKEALKYSKEAGNIDIKIENLYKDRVAEFKDENKRLRDENASLRKSRDRRSLLFGVLGAVAGRFIF